MQPATRESNSERRVGLSPGGCMQKWDVRKTLVTCADLQDVMMFPGWMRLVGICGIRSLDQVCDCIIDCNILQ